MRASRPDVGHQRILGHAARELPRRRRASQHWVAALGLRTEMKAADAWPIKYIWFLWYTILFVIIPCNPAFADRNRRVYVCNVCEGLEFIDSDESFERVAGGTRSEAIVGTLQRCSGLRIGVVGSADLGITDPDLYNTAEANAMERNTPTDPLQYTVWGSRSSRTRSPAALHLHLRPCAPPHMVKVGLHIK